MGNEKATQQHENKLTTLSCELRLKLAMKLSTRARYALRMMLDVAAHGGCDEPVSLAQVADRTGISRGYLEQLAIELRNARLMRAVSGRHGGYKLVGDPATITAGRVMEAVIGRIAVVDCIDEPGACPRADGCGCRTLYELVNRRVAETLQEFTIERLLECDNAATSHAAGCTPHGSRTAEVPDTVGCLR